MPRILVRLLCLELALASGGCEKLFQKDVDRTIEAGDKKAAAGEFRVAVKLYEASFDGTPRTAEVHYKLAVIYDDKLKSPLDTLHHLERYLELTPNGPHAKEAKALQKENNLRLADSLNRGSFVTQEEAIRIKKDNLDLKMQIVALKSKKEIPATTAVPATGKSEAGRKPIPPGVRTYVVQPGDTMASIAGKFYKNKGRWKDIQDANFNATGGTAKIKPGQTLYVPE